LRFIFVRAIWLSAARTPLQQQGNGPKWIAWLRQAGSVEDQTKLARLLVPIELEDRRRRIKVKRLSGQSTFAQ